MLSAYVKRLDGEMFPVGWQHTGQHIGVDGDGAVRIARLYWIEEPSAGNVGMERARLLASVPLLDVLLLTRKASDGGERVVFHGLIQECGTDGHTVTVVAADNPKAQHLFDQPFIVGGELTPSDQPYVAPEAPAGQGGTVRHLSGQFANGAPFQALTPLLAEPASRPGGRPDTVTQWTPSGARAKAEG